MRWFVLCGLSALAASAGWSAVPPAPAAPADTTALPDLLPKALQGQPSPGVTAPDWSAFLRDHGTDPDVAAILKDHAEDPKLPVLLEALPRLGWWIRHVYTSPRVIVSPQPPGVIQLLPLPPHEPGVSVKSGLLLYTPADRKLFRTMHPLLTPDIPTTIYPAEQPRPQGAPAAAKTRGLGAGAPGVAPGSPDVRR